MVETALLEKGTRTMNQTESKPSNPSDQSPKTIAIDARNIFTSTGRVPRKLLEYLQTEDTTNKYIVLLLKKDFDSWNPVSPNFTKMVADFPNYTFSEQLGFAWLLYKLKADLVHFTFQARPILYFRKSVMHVHDLQLMRVKNYDMPWLVFEIKQLVYKLTIGIMIRLCKIIITPTDFTTEDIKKTLHIPAKKITRIYLAADKITESPAEYKQLANKQFIMYVGQSSPYKNIPRLIEAHQILLAEHPSLYLAISGKKDRFTELYEETVRSKGYKQVIFTGFVEESELRWMYEHAAAYIVPSTMEGFGLPGLEAMNYGVPVVSSNATCLPETYGDSVIYFDPLQTQEMADAIGRVLDDPQLRAKLIAAGTQQLKKYSWAKMTKEVHAVYMRLLSE
jgi:glycosyltransferase involved in cell wall biosynthesis